jgi:hypothetical protein
VWVVEPLKAIAEPPAPTLRRRELMLPMEVSVNVTVRGGVPERVLRVR